MLCSLICGLDHGAGCSKHLPLRIGRGSTLAGPVGVPNPTPAVRRR